MAETLRGADIVVRTLERRGVARVFTLSGNHIMNRCGHCRRSHPSGPSQGAVCRCTRVSPMRCFRR
jgi:hypothetical protein